MSIAETHKNRVDELHAEIQRIQSECQHVFCCAEEPKLKESLVKGVFIGYDASRGAQGVEQGQFTIRCSDCSQEKIVYIREICPKCLGKMKADSGLEVREKYFGEDYLYYRASTSGCVVCSFRAVFDEWDQ